MGGGNNDLFVGCEGINGCPQFRCFGYLDSSKATVFETIPITSVYFMLKHPDGYCLTASKNVSFLVTHIIQQLFFYLLRVFYFLYFHLKQLNNEHISLQGYDCTPNNDNAWRIHKTYQHLENKDGRVLWWRGDNGMLFFFKFFF